MSTTLLAVQFSDDEDRRTALEDAIEQQGAEDVDVLHVFDDRGQFVGRWVCRGLLTIEQRHALGCDRDTWHRDDKSGCAWGFIAV